MQHVLSIGRCGLWGNPPAKVRNRTEAVSGDVTVRPSLETTGGTMSQIDPWEKAADCERALRITVDPIRREILSNIREFWIALANERPLLSEQDLAAEIEVISDFHATLDRNNHA